MLQITYKTVRFDNLDRESGSFPAKLLFDKSLKLKLNLLQLVER